MNEKLGREPIIWLTLPFRSAVFFIHIIVELQQKYLKEILIFLPSHFYVLQYSIVIQQYSLHEESLQFRKRKCMRLRMQERLFLGIPQIFVQKSLKSVHSMLMEVCPQGQIDRIQNELKLKNCLSHYSGFLCFSMFSPCHERPKTTPNRLTIKKIH